MNQESPELYSWGVSKQFDIDGIELIIDTETGESFASISGYARMSGKPVDTIAKRVKRLSKGLDISSKNQAQIPTPGGLQGGTLISEDFVCQWLPKDNPKMATQLMKLGVRKFFHQLAGYTVSRSTQALAPAIESKLEKIQEENNIIITMLKKFDSAVETSSEAIAQKAEEKLDEYHGKKALEFKRIRERNEINKYLRRNR